MEIKKIANNTLSFTVNRLIELMGITVAIIGLLLFISLVSYSPDDPNFIFAENTQIKNLLGFRGSFISDIFFQSFGLIALLVPFTFIFVGLNIFLTKELFLCVESLFFTILYSLFGSLFFYL